MSGTDFRISNPAFFARRPVAVPPKVQLRRVPGSKNQALTPLSRTGASFGQKGFTYLGMLIIVAVMGMGLAAFGQIYSHAAQREKEAELLFVGEQFREAIASYYRKSPGSNVYPKTLEDLVEDKRFPMPQRHLRRIYADPMTGGREWGLVEAPGGAGIMGVHSLSEDKPIKSANFGTRQQEFETAESYKAWRFVYSPVIPNPPPVSAPSK